MIRSHTCALAAGVFMLLMPAHAAAQEPGQAGITMGLPGAVGVLWHVTERVALRPEFQFSFITSEAESPQSQLSSSSEGWSISPGASVIFYLQRRTNLRTYVSPRFTFSRSTNTFRSALTGAAGRSTNTSYSGTASFGAQYSLAERFGVYAEIGLGVTRTTGSSDQSSTETRGQQWTTRTGVGAVLYF